MTDAPKKSSQGSILVTGSAGFIGHHLVKELGDLGKQILCLYHKSMPQVDAHVLPVCWDLKQASLPLSALRGAQAVVHLAWEWKETGESNLAMLANVLSSMEQSGTKKLIFVSVVGAASDGKEPFLRQKYEAERMILNSLLEEKVILRVGGGVVCQNQPSPVGRALDNLLSLPLFVPVPYAKKRLCATGLFDLNQRIKFFLSSSLEKPCLIEELCTWKDLKAVELFPLFASEKKIAKICLGGWLSRFFFYFLWKNKHRQKALRPLELFLQQAPLGLKPLD